ncbi:MAG: hypothetical protein ACK4JY_12345 [Brevundimonas sp.]|uniref:hypothetical protein n=1 Tax=Brevundimonas sp. TaxID=1871086 RepID=UPI00391C2807
MEASNGLDAKARHPRFDVPYRSAASILAHPDFPLARATYIRDVLALYGHDPAINKLLVVAARMVLFFVVICLDANYRVEDRSTWPTVGRLKAALATFGLASSRRIDQIVGRLIQTGFIESAPSPVDGRVRLLRPTARTLEHDQDWLIAHYRPLACLFGEADYRLPLNRDVVFQQTQRRVATGFLEESAHVLMRNPGIMLFFSREAGILVVMELVQASLLEGSATIPLSLAGLGERRGVSRTHVRQLLADAEAHGLVDLDVASRQITLAPTLLASLDQFIAEGMSNHDLTHALAISQMSRSVVPGDFALAERGASRLTF